MKAGLLICGLLLGAVLWGALSAVPTTWSQEPPPAADAPVDAEAPEVLTRGPIHEAFAEPLTDPEPGILVPKKPPEDIEEVPPEYAPDLEGAIWIKGYWAWDDEREDFIWISGVHRVPPPGMRWMAGFWDEIEGKGWQWNRGFWIKADVEELSYRDAPPASLEEGPSSPSPGDDYFYVPGHWAYDTDYRWSPGYWAVYRPDCVWVPAHWVWTPGGYVFIPGYCDYSIARRGCLYAPVYFHSAYYTRPGYYYRPWCALNVGNLMIHFWVRPSYCHYYFGNYYGGFGGFGMTPWYQWSYHHHHHHYDPILSWSDVHYHRSGVHYRERLGGWHKHYEKHEHERPPRTWNEQVKLVSQTNITNITQVNKVKNVAVRQNFLAAKVDDMAQVEDAPVKLRKLDAKQQEAAKKSAKLMQEDIVQTREHRRKFERTVALPTGGKTGELAQSEGTQPGAKGAKGGGAKGGGTKGAKADRGGKAGTETTAEAGGAARGKLKLPQAKVKPIAAKVEMPTPARGTGPGAAVTGDGDVAGKTKGAKAGGKAKASTGDVSPKLETPQRPKGKGGKAGGGGEKSPKVETPKVTLPDNKPSVPDAKGSSPRTPPRETAPRELPRPDRTPKVEGGKKSEGALPKIETPKSQPAEKLPAPRSEVPKNVPPRTDSGGGGEGAAPRLARPAVSTPKSVDTPRVERSLPQPRVETPRAEPRVTTPRIETSRTQPRVETPSSQPRISSAPRSGVSRPQPRVERSQPRSGNNRKRD